VIPPPANLVSNSVTATVADLAATTSLPIATALAAVAEASLPIAIAESAETSVCVPIVILSGEPEIVIALPNAIALSELARSTLSPIAIPSDAIVQPLTPITIPLLAEQSDASPMAI
jgi:hypothetical protein